MLDTAHLWKSRVPSAIEHGRSSWLPRDVEWLKSRAWHAHPHVTQPWNSKLILAFWLLIGAMHAPGRGREALSL